MASPTSGVPPSRGHQFSTNPFAVSGAAQSLSRSPMPNLLGAPASQSPNLPASAFTHYSNSSTPRSTGQLSLTMESHCLHLNNSYNESMLTPHRTGYGSSLRTNEFPSEKTTPSFDHEDLPEDLWVGDTLFPSLGASTTSSTAITTIHPTSPIVATDVPGHHVWTTPIAPRQAESIPPIKKLAQDIEPIITQIRRTGTDGSTASWMVSPVVRVEDTESSEVNLALSIDSSSTDTGNVGGIGLTGTLKPSSSLWVERRPRSQSDVCTRRIERDEDGVWCGLSPEMRKGLKSSALGLGIVQGVEYLPMNLKEMEQSQKIHEKNLEVEAWLKKSPVLDSREKKDCQGLTVPSRGRRSKSISDFRFEPSGACESRSGFIEDVDMAEDTDSDEDVSAKDSSWEEGSLDAWGECAEKGNIDTTNSSPENPEKIMSVGPETEEYDPNKDPKLLPLPRQFFSAKPWRDDLTFGPNSSQTNQPSTSNNAIHRFKECADNLETASRVATFGSGTMRGLGLEDVFLSREGILKRLSFGRDKEKDKERSPKERRASIFELPLPFKGHKRTPTNSTQGGPPKSPLGEKSQQDTTSHAAFPPPKRNPSWTRKSKLSIDTAIGQMTGQLAAIGAADGSKSATSGGPPMPWSPFALNSLSPPPQVTKRSRTKSDLSNIGSTLSAKLTKLRPTTKPDLDLATLMQLHGGPPTIPITSSQAVEVCRRHTLSSTASIPSIVASAAANKTGREKQGEADNSDDGDGDDDDDDLVVVPHKPIKKLDIKPTLEGFAAHISELNPLLEQKLVDRIAQEQVKRFKKIEDYKAKHLASLRSGGCPNKNKCSTLNPRATALSTVPNEISGKGGAGEHLDNTIIGAQYPFGIPEPPATHLPAEFECNICFKVKKFSKPSDWTKHVHEDVQPFTCTFPDCTEPKSFKRKADWVRHENERHRHLEWWRCNQPDCHHVCYRKDNFVQHLVREHKFQEPKVKAVRAAMKAKAGVKGDAAGDPVKEQADKVLAIVELCRNDTNKEPSSEKCRFCGTTCSTWKKLTVHLARHMEYISLPILDLLKGGSKILTPTSETSVPTVAAAKIATPISTSATRDEITSQLNTGGGHFCTRHQVGIPTQPPRGSADLFLPTASSGEIGSHSSHIPSLESLVLNTSMPMLSSSPPTAYLDPNPFQDQCIIDDQQHEGGTGGTGTVEFYPTPSGSVSPYLIPSQHSPYLLGQQFLVGTTTPTGGGLLNAPDAQRFTVPTPGTTPPRSRHGLPHSQQQQSQLGGSSPNLDLLSPMSCYPHPHSPLVTSTVGVNMSMLNMSLPATSVSMEQLTYTSGPTSTHVTGMTMDLSMGITMEMGSHEQLRIQDLERRLLYANTNATRSSAPPDVGAVGVDVYAPPSVRSYQILGASTQGSGLNMVEGMSMDGTRVAMGLGTAMNEMEGHTWCWEGTSGTVGP